MTHSDGTLNVDDYTTVKRVVGLTKSNKENLEWDILLLVEASILLVFWNVINVRKVNLYTTLAASFSPLCLKCPPFYLCIVIAHCRYYLLADTISSNVGHKQKINVYVFIHDA